MKQSNTFLLCLILMTVAGFTFIVTSTGLAACPDEITAYWKLDNDYLDFIKGNDGAVVPPSTAPTPDATGINGALAFDGSAGIDVATSKTFGWYETESFTIELWVKTTNVGPQVFIGRDAPGLPTAALQWYVGIGAGGLASFNLSDDDGNGQFVAGVGATRLDDGLWHHVVLVRDASLTANGTTLVYVDGGDPEATYNTVAYDAGFFGSPTAPLTIGYLLVNETTPNFRFEGSLDEVALYDRALSKDEIQAHFAARDDYCGGSDAPEITFAPFPDDTISLWDLDTNYEDAFGDNDGTVVAPSTAPTPDATGINGALAFDGTAGIDVAASRTFGWYESFSIELWVKTTNVGPQVFIGRDAPGLPTAALQWYVGIGAGGLASFNLSDDDGNGQFVAGVGATRLDDGLWHHVVLVRDASLTANGTTLVYVDGGDPEATYNTVAYDAGFFGSSAAPLTIGYLLVNETTPNFRFEGSLDEVALYDRAMDKDEIQEHYDVGLDGKSVTSLRPEPVADAGADQTVSAGATVTLTGTGTDSGGGTISSYLWEQTVGPKVTLSSATSATTTFTAPAASTTLTFLFTVTDNDGLSSSDDITVTVSAGAGPPPVDGGGGDGDGGGGGCFISSMF